MTANRRLGKLAPEHDLEGIRMSSRAFSKLPPAPANTNWVKPSDTFPMFANDTVGCCTFTTQGIITLQESRIAQAEIIWPDSAILAGYKACGNWDGIPGSASDVGLVIRDVINHMTTVGQDIGLQAKEMLTLGYGIDHTDPEMIARCVWKFGSCNLGWMLNKSMAESVNGRWDYDPNSPFYGMHNAPAVDVRTVNGKREFLIATWTEKFWTPAATIINCTDEAWCNFSREHWLRINSLTPLGEDFEECLQYASAMQG
jgi:hypothetical protein